MAFDWHGDTITEATPVCSGYRNTQNVRRFMLDRCGAAFRFDREFMHWIRSTPSLTMGDVVSEWRRRHGLA
ncbi:DUF6434 domain-containing protein [Pseudomonas sp.]|uniref:DUF6434 domain-containing protein n=1 Tax=Pseudomonas sp. TaxID=306 RepID=UPI003D14E3C7